MKSIVDLESKYYNYFSWNRFLSDVLLVVIYVDIGLVFFTLGRVLV